MFYYFGNFVGQNQRKTKNEKWDKINIKVDPEFLSYEFELMQYDPTITRLKLFQKWSNLKWVSLFTTQSNF